MLVRIHPDNPSQRHIDQVVECLKKGGVIIYPTDTVYGIGCNIHEHRAVERICRIRSIDPAKAQFSFICSDLRHITDYCLTVDTPIFKLMKRLLPGPYTFILKANNIVPKILLQMKKRTVGIRIPDHAVPLRIVELLGNPILTTSLIDKDDMIEYTTDPELIHEKYGHLVDMVIDSGIGGILGSTVIDCADGSPVVVREGKGFEELTL